MRARNRRGEPLRHSTYQYQTKFLFFHRSWHGVANHLLSAHIRELLPPDLRRGWDNIVHNNVAGAGEEAAIASARWIAENGLRLGFCTPDTVERNRAYRAESYFGILGLDEYHMFNAQGNAIDPEALLQVFGRFLHVMLQAPWNFGCTRTRSRLRSLESLTVS